MEHDIHWETKSICQGSMKMPPTWVGLYSGNYFDRHAGMSG